jgi:GNAT superfamily N-acetyltransferase
MGANAFSRTELLELSDHNLAQFFRFSTRLLPQGELHEEAGVLTFAGGDAGTNGAIRTASGASPDAAALWDRVGLAFPDATPHRIVTRAHHDADVESWLSARGYECRFDLSAMVLDGPTAPPAATARIRPVRTEADVASFRHVTMAAFPASAQSLRLMFASPASLLTPGVAAFVADVDGQAASVALVITHGQVAGVEWVGTLPAFRGRGLAEAVSRAASNAGFDLGARIVALQGADDAARLYGRIGYREVSRYRWFGPGESP